MEVDSVADLQVPVLDGSDIKGRVVDAQLVAGFAVGSIAGSFPGIGTVRAPMVADA